MKNILRIILSFGAIVTFTTSFAQTPHDTIKLGKPDDGMVVDPGKVNDGMAVKPGNPHDGMSIVSDTAFINKNLRDNIMEIKLSKLGKEKGTSPLVKKVAEVMITDHTAILTDLRKIAVKKHLSEGYNQNEQTKEMVAPAGNLPSGKEFDQEWAGQMLAMHEAKIAELESFLGLTKDAALKSAVMKAIPKIKLHREMLLKIPGAKEKSASPHII